MKKIIIVIVFLMGSSDLISQTLPTFLAPEPTKVYEFTKYDQIPVGEYTGVPNISIPLHSIKVDDVEVPVGLQYHAGGFRVNEEASNVGLGWNMNFGMLTQSISDKDDLTTIQYSKQLLKYQKAVYPLIYEWPWNCSNTSLLDCQTFPTATDCTPEPIFVTTTPSISNSIFIATNGYPIVGKSFCQTQDLDVTNPYLDTEPDIFRVNFLGHSLKFIKRFDTANGTIEVLDNKGYKVETITDVTSPNGLGWKITAPDGNQFFFGKMRQDNTSTHTDDVTPDFLQASGNSYTNNWSLIKIVTAKHKTIDFEYTDYGITKTNSDSQMLRKISQVNTWNSYPSYHEYKFGSPSSTIYENQDLTLNPFTYTAIYEKMMYVSKITTPSEVLTFQYSDRIDRMNDKKLDKIIVKNHKLVTVKNFDFSYDYFVATETGNMYANPTGTVLSTHNTHRLKLLSVQETGSNPYKFIYDPINLPRKFSNAVDFWGFYNGKITNTSLVPNPATIGYPAFGNNGNDKSAYESYAKASVLKSIQYPTGGKIEYDYELNEYLRTTFETVLPNAGNVIGNSVKGNGIRVKSISLTDRTILQKKVSYSYVPGFSLVPFEILKHYTATNYVFIPESDPFPPVYHGSTFTVDEFNNSNYQRPSLLGSYNMVGYGQVTTTEVGLSGKGKTVYTFANKRDDKSFHQHDYKVNIQMPSLMDVNAIENGKILSKEIYEEGSTLPLARYEYGYINQKSNIFYGNIISHFRDRFGFNTGLLFAEPSIKPQFLVGYYAIYDRISLLSSEKVTEYFPSGTKWSITDYGYDSNNLLYSTVTKDESGQTISSNSTNFYSTPDLIARNWLNLPQSVTSKSMGGNTNTVNYTYQTSGPTFHPASIEVLPNNSSDPTTKKKIFYDQYDNKGNIMEFHDEQNLYTSIIWGYDKLLPIAKIENATYAEVAPYVINLENLSNTGSEQDLQVALANLRASLPNAMVTTFTHFPLVGVRTITDAKGETTTYTYDANNRLKNVKDNDGHILSENEYRFRPQN